MDTAFNEAAIKHQVMVTLDEHIYQELKDVADSEERTVASYIRRLIKKELADRREEE